MAGLGGLQSVSESRLDDILSIFAEDAVGVYPPMPAIGVAGGPVRGATNQPTISVLFTCRVSDYEQ